MKSNKLVLTYLALTLIVVISEAGNVMKTHSHPSRRRTGTVGNNQRRGSPSRLTPDERTSRPNTVHRRKPAEAPARSPSPAGRSPGSRSNSPGASSIRNSQSLQVQRRKIPKIVITPPDNERPRTDTAKPVQKKVTFSDPLVNIKYIEPNPVRRRKPTGA